ncbi:hypothetical protein GW17_00028971 [Ensete ventricosum]|nr:hypothetical protein GW17_00028971 [Ensete ventricosum]
MNRSVTIEIDHDHPLPGGISLAAAREEEASKEKGEHVQRRGRRIGKTSRYEADSSSNDQNFDPDPMPPSLDNPEPGGNDEATTKAAEEAVSFIASSATSSSLCSSLKAKDFCDLHRIPLLSAIATVVRCSCCPLPLLRCCLLLLSAASTGTATVVCSTVRCRSQHYHEIAVVYSTVESSSVVRSVHRYYRSQH